MVAIENKILAVDISIWLNQAAKGFRDRSSYCYLEIPVNLNLNTGSVAVFATSDVLFWNK
jgi:hypothetical protein